MNDFSPEPDDFGAASIKVLYFPESMRLRPQMYVGDVRDGSGLHRMVEFTIDDALVRRPSQVIVSLRPDGMIVVTDDGLPLPYAGPFVGSLCAEGDARVRGSIAEAVQTALTRLDTQGTGWALSTVNALSSQFSARLWRDGDEHVIGFEDGKLVTPLVRLGPGPPISSLPRHVAEISFVASTEIFGTLAYDTRVIRRHLGELAKQHPDVRFALE